MIKKVIILFIACAIISCKKDQDTTPLNIQGAIKTERLLKDFTCNSATYLFQSPLYKGEPKVQERLNKDIKNLISQDLSDASYDKDASLKEIWDLFIAERKRNICDGDTSGLNHIQIEHLSQNDAFISYEITYNRNGVHQRLHKTYIKPDLTELKITDLAKSNKIDDVRRIYDINLQQSVANLALEIKPENYDGFKNFVENKVFAFSKEEFENASLGINIISADSVMLQVSKKINLPSTYSFLNEDVKIAIRAQEMDYYLDIAPLKI
ncbi:hypothetical protein [Nonlabens sp.]|uniref:hypothetical protein n=1 Tax=Nonlabens sp. TaxID=1888209 RepID=UPI003F69F6FA